MCAGQLRRSVKLGSEATYRVLEVIDSIARVKVISAPALPSDSELHLTVAALQEMDIVTEV